MLKSKKDSKFHPSAIYYPSIRKRDDFASGNCIHIPPLSKLFSWLRNLLGVLSKLKKKKKKKMRVSVLQINENHA